MICFEEQNKFYKMILEKGQRTHIEFAVPSFCVVWGTNGNRQYLMGKKFSKL